MLEQPQDNEIGRSKPRSDGRGKVVGSALYTDDLQLQDLGVSEMWHAATVRSPHACAKILRIDSTMAAAQDPDVVVFTAADLIGPNVVQMINDDWPILAAERCQHVGEAVALVAAPTRARAMAAAELVRVDYEELPAVFDLDDALRGDPRANGAPLELATCGINHGEVDKAWGEADIIVEHTYESGLQEHIYIEPQAMIAIPQETGAIELVGSMQCPYYVQKALALLLETEPDQVRVRQAETGGGFGGKEDYPDLIGAHAALLARKLGKPVKIIYDRHEDIVATSKRHPSRVRHRTGVTRDGRLVVADVEVLLDGGAYTTLSPVVLSRGVIHAIGPYSCPNVRVRGRVLATNTVPNGAFRGFGAPQVQYAAERHLDRIARALNIDPLTIRERNAYRVGDVTPTGQTLAESVSALECLAEAERLTNFRARWQRQEESRRVATESSINSPGIGLSLVWHGTGFTGSGEERMRSPATIRLNARGRIEVRVAATDFGQGTNQVLAQIVADGAGVRLEHVDIIAPDTALVPDSGPTVASRTVMIVGGILTRAAQKLSTRLVDHLVAHSAAKAGQADPKAGVDVELVDGNFLNSSSEPIAAFESIAADLVGEVGPIEITEYFEAPAGAAFDDDTYQGVAYAAYGWCCNVVELSVDTDTLELELERATMICDVGKAIHPILCKGQVEGGTLQALGHGYLEEMTTKRGRVLQDRLQTYIIPTIQDTPDMETVLIENPSTAGPSGAKGVGELPMDGGAAAVCSAIENATGIPADTVPATPERLLDQLHTMNLTASPAAGSHDNRPGDVE